GRARAGGGNVQRGCAAEVIDGVGAHPQLDRKRAEAGGGCAVVDGDGVVGRRGVVGAGVDDEIGDVGEGDRFEGGPAAGAGDAGLAANGAVEGERIVAGGRGEGEVIEGVDED